MHEREIWGLYDVSNRFTLYVVYIHLYQAEGSGSLVAILHFHNDYINQKMYLLERERKIYTPSFPQIFTNYQ